jgi:hypothetical protein
MAEPWTFSFNATEQTFTFDNGHVAFEVKTDTVPLPPAPPEPVTVESVSLTTPHHDVDLGITNVEVPLPVVEHLASHFFPPDLLLHI